MKEQAQRDIVILAGSGRSGTTWLGSILNAYERSEYFYEITNYPELDFGQPELLKIKYPLTHGWSSRPDWAARIERRILSARVKWGPDKDGAKRSLRVFSDHRFHKDRPNVDLYKIVTLYGFVQRRDELAERFGERLKVVHLIRNPFAQIASELRIDARDPGRSKAHFRRRVEQILEDSAMADYHDAAQEALGREWVYQMALVWRASNETLIKDRLLDKRLVIYEHLCAEPARVVSELFDWLGWQLSDQTRRYIKETSDVLPSQAESGLFSVRKNADESMTRWRRELDESTYEESLAALQASDLMSLWEETELQRNR